jgi:hypothetical protein
VEEQKQQTVDLQMENTTNTEMSYKLSAKPKVIFIIPFAQTNSGKYFSWS